MDPLPHPSSAFAWSTWIVFILLKVQQALQLPPLVEPDEDSQQQFTTLVHGFSDSEVDASSMLRATLHNYRLCTAFMYFEEDLGFWVKPRSTTWFSRFLLDQYDYNRWVQMFRMTKPAVFALAGLLRPHVERADTKYRVAVPVLVRVACTLFKLSYGANITICSEMFAIGRSTVSKVQSHDGFFPYVIGDLGYLLLPWLMVPHRTHGQLTVAEALFNRKLRRGRCVVENAFGILKQTFCELLQKSDLSVTSLPDVILACAILHNVLLGQSHEQVEELLEVLRVEGLEGEVVDDGEVPQDAAEVNADNVASPVATQKRSDLGVYLTMQYTQQG